LHLAQYAFVALLGVLVTAVVSFVVMGLAKFRRARHLARAAHERGMRFFRDDPFDVPRRYAGFAVISSGHSARANNVTDGRLGSRPVRAFDFRYELGHGTRRITRHYSVITAETGRPCDSLLMWHEGDADLAPLAARDSEGRVALWGYRGARDLAADVAAACSEFEECAASVEIRGSVVVVAAPARRSTGRYAVSFGQVSAILGALQDQDRQQAVANCRHP